MNALREDVRVSHATVANWLAILEKGRFPECEAWHISAVGSKHFVSPEGIRICPALAFLRRLP